MTTPQKDDIIAAIRTVHDPEIPVNLYDLGLIYSMDIGDAGRVDIRMTLTAPNCPVADQLPAAVEKAVRGVEGVSDVSVQLVFDPPWTTEMMTDEGQIELEAMGIDPRRAKENLPGSRPTGLTFNRREQP